MGNAASSGVKRDALGFVGRLGALPRGQGITEGNRKGKLPKLPPNAVKASAEDWPFIQARLRPWAALCCSAGRGPEASALYTRSHRPERIVDV